MQPPWFTPIHRPSQHSARCDAQPLDLYGVAGGMRSSICHRTLKLQNNYVSPTMVWSCVQHADKLLRTTFTCSLNLCRFFGWERGTVRPACSIWVSICSTAAHIFGDVLVCVGSIFFVFSSISVAGIVTVISYQ